MPTYVRSKTAGGTFFFTVVAFQRRRLFADPQNPEVLSNIITEVQQEHPFTLDAWVLLARPPAFSWTLPPGEADYSKRLGLIKAKFTKAISTEAGRSARLTAPDATGKAPFGKGGFGSTRFEMSGICRCTGLYSFQPREAWIGGFAGRWLYSSFWDFVDRNLYPDNWGKNLI